MTDTTTEPTDTAEQAAIAAGESDSSIALLPPVQAGSVAAYESLDRHVHAVKKAQWLADAMCKSAYVPQKFQGKPDDGTAAILFGAEVGLSPIASLRSVIVIHGMPGFEARTMKAILMGHGYRFKQVEATREVCRVAAWSPKGDEAEAEITLDDCKLEGWVPKPAEGLDHDPDPDTKTDWVGEWKTGRNGEYYVVKGNMKYITSPRTMLIAKATAAVCRDIAPHLLLGMPAAEDMYDSDWDGDAPGPAVQQPAPKTRQGGRGTGGLRARAQAAAAEPKQEPIDVEVEPDATDVAPPQETPAGAGDTNEADTKVEDATAGADQGPAAKLRESARKTLNEKIVAMFGKLGMTGDTDEDKADRLVIVRAIVERDVDSTKDLTDAELQKLRNGLVDRDKAGTLEAAVTEWLNIAAIKADQAAQAAEEAAAKQAES